MQLAGMMYLLSENKAIIDIYGHKKLLDYNWICTYENLCSWEADYFCNQTAT